jgi:hypothetical protein
LHLITSCHAWFAVVRALVDISRQPKAETTGSVVPCCQAVCCCLVQDAHTCSRCFSAAACAATHAALEGGDAASSGMDPAQWQELAGGITPAAGAWLRRWMDLLDWEESGGKARRGEIWGLTGGWVGWVAEVEGCS